MSKYKIVGLINFFLGFFEIIFPLLAIIFTIPKLIRLYSELEVRGPSLIPTYIILSTIILMGIGNFFLGIKLISKSEDKEKYFKYAMTLIVASFLVGGVFASISSLSAVIPIYNLTSQL